MKLSEKLKKEIDNMSYKEMLSQWRFSHSGTPLFEGYSGEYFGKIMSKKKETVDHVSISKEIG